MEADHSKCIEEATLCLKTQIEFLEVLIKHVNGSDPALMGRAMWAASCLHGYFNVGLINDLKNVIKDLASQNLH